MRYFALTLLVSSFMLLAFDSPGLTDKEATEWKSWSPRPELAPAFAVREAAGRSKGHALKISAQNENQYGAWKKVISGIEGGATYRFTAWYRPEKISNERRSIIPRLQWLDAKGKPARAPDFAIDVAAENGWKKIEHLTPAPTNATQVEIQLSLAFTGQGSVLWDDIQIERVPESNGRIVRAATVFCRPRGKKFPRESVEEFCQLALTAAKNKPDIICFPEGITVIGTGKSYYEVSEPLPGPTTKRLGTLAKELNSYIVAGFYERAGELVYNTAVLIDRQGNLAGSYRKTHLPREEWELGITPGNAYPVFETDFGKVGLTVCWDLQFPEPARAMALKGAEIILLPIWGGSEILAQARAIENHVFLVTSSYDMRTFIVDPAGKILAEATKEQPVAFAELHLDRKIFQPWLGDMKNRTWKEWRPDLPVK